MRKQRKTRRERSKYTNLIVGAVFIVALVLVSILADVIAPYPYDAPDMSAKLEAPSSAHPLGTDNYGRDVFSRVLFGCRIALKVALFSVGIQLLLGVSFGLASGFYGGLVDKVLCFVMDITWAMPPIIMAFAVIAIIGKTLDNAIIAISIVCWANFGKLVRTKTMSIKNMAFIETAVAFGENNFALMFRYILPNIIPSVVVIASLSVPSAIMSTTALSYLGLGAQSPSPDWGLALSESMAYVTRAPWLGIYPGIALVLTTFGFMMLSEGVRDLLDPHMKSV